MHKLTTSFSKAAALLFALVLSLMAVSPAAHADDDLHDFPTIVDPDRTGSLTVHKDEGDPLTQYGDPTNPDADLNREPVEGIVFQAQKIEGADYDLSTNEGWVNVSKLNKNDLVKGGSQEHLLGDPGTATTNADGDAVFADLAIGAYYVTEQASEAADRHLTVADPFIVTIPSTVDYKEWNYHVKVDAKDQKIVAHKAEDREFAEIGDEVEYGIGATTPAPNTDKEITRYEIVDPLFFAIKYVDGTSTVKITRDDEDDDPIELTVNEDFAIKKSSPNTVRMVLLEPGLEKLAAVRDGNPKVKVNWYFKVKVLERPSNGLIPNRAWVLTPGYPEWDDGDRPGVPTNEVIVEVPEEDTPPPPTGSIPLIPIVPIPVPVPPPGSTPPGSTPPGTTPVSSPTPPTPSTPAEKIRDRLASTGANVLWVLFAGVVMLIIGTALARRRSDDA